MKLNWYLLPLVIISRPIVAADAVMPKDLVDFAQKSGCTQIEDFYDRTGMVNPPYVYGYLPGDAEKSAVLWCKKTSSTQKPYLLLVKSDAQTQSISCSNSIEWWNYPGGLSIDRSLLLPLSDFHYVTDTRKSGPQGVKSNGNVIVSYYDGVSTFFYCYNGQWLYYVRD